MLLALAVLLMQPQITPQLSFSAEKIAQIQPAIPTLSINTSLTESELPIMAASAETVDLPVTEPDAAALPSAPEPTPAALILVKPSKPMTVSVGELLAEGRRNRKIWLGLGIASHSAATFDAWSTRHAITTTGAQELNPMLKPFAGNASLYAAIQVGPVVMDYIGKKMMYSRHNWMRRMWWVPQSASIASSLFCGGHNLTVH